MDGSFAFQTFMFEFQTDFLKTSPRSEDIMMDTFELRTRVPRRGLSRGKASFASDNPSYPIAQQL